MKQDPEIEAILTDALSMKLFNKNVNPSPSKSWFMMATDQEIGDWQLGDKELEKLLMSRLLVKRSVELYTREQMEEDEGIRHSIPPLQEDLTDLREIPIHRFTLATVRKSAGKYLTKCIFHDDTKPSCVLYDTQGYYCFSCGASGNSIDWAMQEFGFTFKQAAEFLSKYV